MKPHGMLPDIRSGDMMVRPDLHTAQARGVRFCLIGADAFVYERDRVIDPARIPASMERVPARAFVRMDRRQRTDVIAHIGNSIALVADMKDSDRPKRFLKAELKRAGRQLQGTGRAPYQYGLARIRRVHHGQDKPGGFSSMVSDRRYGRFRGVILALVGIALSGASPQKADKSEPPDHSSGQIANSLESIASILKDAQKPSKHDEPCPEGYDDRSSDLCAQWKAADATKSGTTATWVFGAIGSVIGLLTLGAAGAAAFYAREAARHTHTGAKEAKRSADAAEEAMHTAMNAYEMQIRPYVAITVQDDSDRAPFSRETVHKFCIKNFGQIPATSVRLTLGEATCHEPIGAFVVSLGEQTGDYGLLAPQDFRTETIHSRGLLPSEIAEWASGRVKFLVRLRIDYTWPEGSDHHDITMILENVATNEWSLLTEERRQRLSQTE